MFLAHLVVQGPRNPERPRATAQHHSAVGICRLWVEHGSRRRGQEEESGESSVDSPAFTSLILTVYRMVWQSHFSALSRFCQKQLWFSSLTFSAQVCHLWMKDLKSCIISQLLLHWCYVKDSPKSLCSLHITSLSVALSVSRDGWSGLGRAGFQIAGLAEVCFTSRGLGYQIPEMQDSRNKQETASRTVWWRSKNSAHTVSSTHAFLVGASHIWPG